MAQPEKTEGGAEQVAPAQRVSGLGSLRVQAGLIDGFWYRKSTQSPRVWV